MKICQVVPYFPYQEHLDGYPVEDGYNIGGVERHVYHISKNLSKLGHEVTILTTRSPRHRYFSEIDMEVKIIRVPISVRIYNSCISTKILRCFDPEQFDIIHAHTPVPMIADLAGIKSFKKRPFVLTYHNEIGKEDILGNIVSQIYNVTLGNFLLTRANLIIATTQSYAKDSMQLRKHLQKVRIIPNGVDVEIFNSRLDGHEIREKYDLDETAKIILFVGRLDHYKGCHYLINAFSRVLNDIPEARLILVGKGPLEMELRSQIRKKGLTSKIILAGYVRDKDLPNYYGASDLFVLPSISFHEGFGLVQLEAMACGKPVITTTLSGVAEVDSEGTCSIHVPPKDEISLAEAIKHLLKKCRVMEDMAKNARKKAINYSWENVVKKLEVTYKDINS